MIPWGKPKKSLKRRRFCVIPQIIDFFRVIRSDALGKIKCWRDLNWSRQDYYQQLHSRKVFWILILKSFLEGNLKKFEYIPMEIDCVTKELQNWLWRLSDCRLNLDILTAAVNEAKNRPLSKLCGCRLGNKYNGPNSSIIHMLSFESGVLNIQHGKKTTKGE